MRLMRFLALLSLVLIGTFADSQELPPLQHFTPDVYNGGSQNWEIAQAADKKIFIANNNGLLVFNGARWNLYETPNQTIMRAVSVIGEKVYTGSYMEFGFWYKSDNGQLIYESLSDMVRDQLQEDEEIWEIQAVDSRIAFQSLKQIYLYDPQSKSFEIIPADGTLYRMFVLEDELFFQQEDFGLFKLSKGAITPVINDSVVLSDEIIQIIPRGDERLIITRNSGIHSWSNGRVKKLSIDGIPLNNLSIYSAISLKNGQIIIGTISNGLLHLSKDLSLVQQIDQRSGLGNNTVLSLYEDAEQNIWAGLDNGLTCINSHSAIRVFKDDSGRLGTVYASAIWKGLLYLGTNQGLFVRPFKSNIPFEFIAGTEGQVWDLAIIGKSLFCGHHQGTFVISGKKAERIPRTKGTWRVLPIENENNLLLQGTYEGLDVLEKANGKWSIRNHVEGFRNSARHLELAGNQIFVNHEYKGVFILTIDKNYRKILNTSSQKQLIGANSALTKYQGSVIYLSSQGFFFFDPTSKQFKPSESHNSLITSSAYVSGRLPLTADGKGFWLFTKKGIKLVTGVPSDTLNAVHIPLSLGTRNDMEEYENMLQVDSSRFILGRTDGYLLIDLQHFELPTFTIKLESGKFAPTNTGQSLIAAGKNHFGHEDNNFQFEYSTPVYSSLFKPTYQTRLLGIYDNWIDQGSNPMVSYDNLPPGKYTFEARARIGDKLAANTVQYAFEVARPWYLTKAMQLIYFCSFIVLSVLMHKAYRSYYKRQQAQLVKQNSQALEYQRMKNEQEIIKLKNTQLQASYESKSKELATSLMNIVNKNELLNQIKDQLLRLKDQDGLSSVIRTIDQNLNQKKNWEMFKEAFDNADSDFFKNLKERHPGLSPNDLKLCAYLRLNLSSKEIAPLINISPRSVEIKRYRLRKKLNLDSNENLVNYILEI